MNFLVTEGYKDAAEKFQTESGADPGIDLESISERMTARRAIQNGDVQSAVELSNALDPLIFDKNPALLFHLRLQKLIELIRANDVVGALRFAERELAPMCEKNPQFVTDLEPTMRLLAFKDITKSPTAYLLSATQRQKTANELNAAILNNQGQGKDRKLPGMFNFLDWGQKRLKEYTDFPEMCLEDADLNSLSASL